MTDVLIDRVRAVVSRPTSTALLHGAGATVLGVALATESPQGYAPRVFDGPEALWAWTGHPWQVWGLLFALSGVAVLALRGGPASRWALAVITGCWGGLAGPALWLGVTESAASMAGGIAFAMVCAGALRGATEFDRSERRERCALAEDCLRLPAPRVGR